MKKSVLIETIICMFLFSSVSFAAFPDVTDETPYKPAIEWMQENTVIQGYPDGTFKPDQCVNRAEFLKMLFLAHQNRYENMVGDFEYSDVPLNEWYTRYVNYFSANQIIEGYPDGSFKPGQCVNRAEAIKMAVLEFGMLLDLTEISAYDSDAGFTDVRPNAWYFQTNYSATDRNAVGLEHVIYGNDPSEFATSYFYPGDSMSRKEVAELLFRMKALADNDDLVYSESMIPNPLEIKIYCLEDAFLTDIGRYAYPVDPQYVDISLGELFTADDCKSFDENMIYKIFGVENSNYTLGSSLHLKIPEAQQTDVATVLEEIGYQCMDNNEYCVSWKLTGTVPVTEILRLKPYADVITYEDCVNCG